VATVLLESQPKDGGHADRSAGERQFELPKSSHRVRDVGGSRPERVRAQCKTADENGDDVMELSASLPRGTPSSLAAR
jgi:hypothetical protein